MHKSTIVAANFAALSLGLAALAWWHYRERAALEEGVLALQRRLMQREQAARRSDLELQAARAEVRTARESLAQSRHAAGASASSASAPRADVATTPTPDAPTTASIMRYLGEPVRPPPALDPKYTAEGLAAAFTALCQSRGLKVQQFAVDTSEFPFLVYGLLEGGRDFFRQIDGELKTVPGYAYGGSVVGSTRDGSTYFSLNMTPRAAYAGSDAEAIQRRMMIRLQMLGVIWTDPKP
jgi:hypothetical protein